MEDNGSSMLENSETQPVVNGAEHDVEMKDELAPEVGFSSGAAFKLPSTHSLLRSLHQRLHSHL